MPTVETLRNDLIDKLLTISNKDYLFALNKLVEKNTVTDAPIQLSRSQIAMLQLSDDDITHGRLISQEDLDKRDLEWLNGL
jgi:hypothetical protein